MLSIDDKPDRPVCSTHGPLRWGWFPDTRQGGRWVSWTLESVDGLGAVLVPHLCDDPDRPASRWRPDPALAERSVRYGRAIAEQMGWVRAKSSTKKETDGG